MSGCLVLLVSLVEGHEQVLLHREGGLHDAVETRLEAAQVLLLHLNLLEDLLLVGQALSVLLRQPFPLLQLPVQTCKGLLVRVSHGDFCLADIWRSLLIELL